MTPQPQGLISVLLDKDLPLGDRDDAAMDLEPFDQEEAEAALLSVVLDQSEDEDLIDSAGESLWAIWKRKRKMPADLVARMHPAAKKFFHAEKERA
jgi:hypothetical protein